MAFDGKEGDWITLDNAKAMTENFRTDFPEEKKGAFLGIEKIREILNQEVCMGIRVYFARNEKNELTIVMVGADSEERDLTDKILDVAQPCPPFCGVISPE